MTHISEKLKAAAEPRLRLVAEMVRQRKEYAEIARTLDPSKPPSVQRIAQLVARAKERGLLE